MVTATGRLFVRENYPMVYVAEISEPNNQEPESPVKGSILLKNYLRRKSLYGFLKDYIKFIAVNLKVHRRQKRDLFHLSRFLLPLRKLKTLFISGEASKCQQVLGLICWLTEMLGRFPCGLSCQIPYKRHAL